MKNLILLFALLFGINTALADTLTFGKWDLTCSEAGCGGSCYIGQTISEDIYISATFYGKNLMLNLYYSNKYNDSKMSLIIDNEEFPLEKMTQYSRLKIKEDRLNVVMKAENVRLIVDNVEQDLSIKDFQNASNHLMEVQQIE